MRALPVAAAMFLSAELLASDRPEPGWPYNGEQIEIHVSPPVPSTVPTGQLDALAQWILAREEMPIEPGQTGELRGDYPIGDVRAQIAEDRIMDGPQEPGDVAELDYGYTWDALYTELSDGTCITVTLPGEAAVYVRTTPLGIKGRYAYNTGTHEEFRLCNPVDEVHPGLAQQAGILVLPYHVIPSDEPNELN